MDAYIIDSTQSINASISGFQPGDVIWIANRTASQGINFINSTWSDGAATLVAGSATIDLTGLASDLFNNEITFDSLFGAGAIAYNTPPTGSLSITGSPVQGHTLTAVSSIVDPDGLGTFSYHWFDNGSAIQGATQSTLILSEAQVGGVITASVSYVDGHGSTESVLSAGTTAVANVNDPPVGAVTINGAATQGQVLTASNTLSDADGLGAITYHWQANGSDIAGATGNTFVLTEAQVGTSIKVVATYTDGHGTAESVASQQTLAVANVNDLPVGSVSISGTPIQGQVLTASNNLTDADGLGSIQYHWQANGDADRRSVGEDG